MKTRIYLPLLSLSLIFCLSLSLEAQYIRGEGPIVTEEFQLDEFKAIGLSIAANISITEGTQQKVVVSGQKNIIDNIVREVKGNGWEIKFDRRTKNYEKLTIEITMKTLEELSIAGSGNVKTTNTIHPSNGFELSIAGSGNADIKLETNKVECSISGSGDARFQGTAEDLEISIVGSGDVEAYDLKVNRCDISTAGSGNSKVNVSGELEASIIGSGDVYYNGDPKIDVSVIGSGNVKRGK